MLVLIYLAEPAALEGTRVNRGWRNRIRSHLMKALDFLRWKFLEDYRIDFNAWQEFQFTNKGDAAIRKAIALQLRGALPGADLEFEEVTWGALSVEHVERLKRRGGLFVIGGSGYFHADEQGNVASRLSRDLRLIEGMRGPCIAYGVGVNQFIKGDDFTERRPLNNAAAETVRGILASLDAISVRDQASMDILKPLTSASIHLTGDPALFLNDAAAARRNSESNERLSIGLNFALHGPGSARTLPARMKWILPVVQTLQETWNCRLCYFVHSDLERIFPMLLRMKGIDVEIIDGSVDQLLATYGKTDLHLCQMLHSSILSISAGVPTLNVAYDTKNLEFFRLMGVEEFCIRPSEATPGKVLERFASLRDHRESFLTQVNKCREDLGQSLRDFHREIASVVDLSQT